MPCIQIKFRKFGGSFLLIALLHSWALACVTLLLVQLYLYRVAKLISIVSLFHQDILSLT